MVDTKRQTKMRNRVEQKVVKNVANGRCPFCGGDSRLLDDENPSSGRKCLGCNGVF